MSSKSKEILEILLQLTTPEKQKEKDSTQESSKENQFDCLLHKKICLLHQKLTSATFPALPSLSALKYQTSPEVRDHIDIRWNYTTVCLHLVLLLQKDMVATGKEFQKQMIQNPPSMKTPHQAPPLAPDVLSIEQEKTILTTLQFIVCLGICPNLEKGVGIPLDRRSGFGSLLGGNGSAETGREERLTRLGICGRVLTACLQVPSLSALVISRHLNDLLAVLLQLNHGAEGIQSKPSKTLNSDTDVMNKHSHNNDLSATCTKQFSKNETLPQVIQDCNMAALIQADGESDGGVLSKTEKQMCEHQEKVLSRCVEPLNSLMGELNIVETDQEFGETTLQRLLSKLSPSLLVRELVMLQGGAKPRSNVKVKSKALPVSPPWLRQVCGRLMTDILMRPQGLMHVLQGMLPFTAAQTGVKAADTGDWKKCQAVAMVIAHCPIQASSVEEYYKHISPQMLALLHHSDGSMSRHYLRVIVALITEMSKQHASLVQHHLLQPILTPLQRCSNTEGQDGSDQSRKEVVVQEKALSLCIQDIHKIYVVCTEAQSCVGPVLSHLIPVIFHLYCSCKAGVSHLRTPCEEILITFLKQTDANISLEFLWLLSTGIRGNCVKDVHMCPPHLVFQAGDSGGMIGVLKSTDSAEELSAEARVKGLIELVKHLQNTTLAGDFFIKLLKELTAMVSSETKEDVTFSTSTCEKEKGLFMLEEKDRQEVELFNRRLMVLNLLASLCEELDSSCLKKTEQILDFVRATLERGVQVCHATGEELTLLFESETLSMALGLLTAVMSGAVQVEERDRMAMQELLPLLNEIRHDHSSEEVREMADDLRIAIATRGAVWSDLMKQKADKKKTVVVEKDEETSNTKDVRSVRPLIQVISETTNDIQSEPSPREHEEKYSSTGLGSTAERNTDKDIEEKVCREKQINPTSVEGESTEKNLKSSCGEVKNAQGEEVPEIEQAFSELCDPEIPVRGHGLLRLTHLIQKKDVSVLSRAETLLKVFEENLQHQDSYLYLASVSGLAALADQCPDVVVPKLAREFAEFDMGPRKKSPELRMKLGESLVKAARNLGDMIPLYRDILLAAILSGACSDNAMVRASSLSNLAEFCCLLRFSLGNIVQEVFVCCSSIAKTDPDAEARKGAVLTLTLLLQGLGNDTLQVLESVLKDLYRLLKLVHTSDTNEMVRTHALLALNELDSIMRNTLFPQQKLQKKITVLHPD